MLNAEEFRRIALRMEGAVEKAHMGHPDFRANGRIFATLYPRQPSGEFKSGTLMLTPEQQQKLVRAHPETYQPIKGGWGRQGATSVRLDSADEDIFREAMKLAWQKTVKKTPKKRAATKLKSRRASR